MITSRPISPTLDDRFKSDPELAQLLRESVNEAIGESLSAVRFSAGLSQDQVARAMGVSRSRVSQIESTVGVRMTLDVLSRYATALGCRLDIDMVDPRTDRVVGSVLAVHVPYDSLADDADTSWRVTTQTTSREHFSYQHDDNSVRIIPFQQLEKGAISANAA